MLIGAMLPPSRVVRWDVDGNHHLAR
jgi:hypothetical protein